MNSSLRKQADFAVRACLLPLALFACTTTQHSPIPLAHPIHAASDGWAALEGPVTGGQGASPGHIFTVRNRTELVKALSGGRSVSGDQRPSNQRKVIYIEGTIDLSVDAQNRPLVEADYADPAFNWPAYESAFSPATWGKRSPEGPLEDARKRSADKQGAVVVIQVGSNTSLIGIGPSAKLINGGLLLRESQNVIVHNLHFEDAYDYFPAWDPKDNASGEWNALYDNITLWSARRVWINHCTFSDGGRPDHLNRSALGRPMMFHDGLLDIVRGSDLITISHSHFKNHDKVMLIGNGDNRTDDAGKLRVTLHHIWFEDVKERAPRVRYGRVHVYNNLYTASPGAAYRYGYSIGVGVQSQIIAHDNAFDLPGLANPRVFKYWRGEAIHAERNILNGATEVDAIAMLKREAPQAKITSQVDWTPSLQLPIDPLGNLAERVKRQAGAAKR